MKTHLELNINTLKKNYPSIYEFVNDKAYDKDTYVISESKNNEVNICIQTADTPLFLHSKYNPSKEAESWVESVASQVIDVKHILIFGLALGYHIQALITRFPDKKIYIYEPDYHLFMAALETRSLKTILEHPNLVTLALGQDESVRHSLLNTISQYVSHSFQSLILPIYYKTSKDLIEKFAQDTEKVVRDYRASLSTLVSFQEHWPENILNNVVKNLACPSIQSLQSTCNGLTAVIVGSGPSLQSDIDYLRKLDQHCLIIAAGSSIQALLRHQIEPHLIVSMDGGQANLHAFEKLDISRIPLLYSPQIKYEILEGYEENLLHVMYKTDLISQYLFDSVDKLPLFYSTTTVTGMAIQAAIYLGCNRIVFMGQDLSYPNNQYYTTGVDHITESSISEQLKNATEWVENVDGEKNRTTVKMLVTLNDVETLLNMFPEVEFINTSKMGAKIKYTEFRLIEEIYEDLKSNHMEVDWFKMIINQKAKHYDLDTIKKVIIKVHNTKKELQAMEKKLNDLNTQLRRLAEYVKSGKGNENKIFYSVNKLWKSITNRGAFDNIYNFGMQHYISLYMRYVPQIVEQQDNRKKAALIVQHLGALVAKMIQYTPVYLHLFDEAIKRIDARFPDVVRGEL